MTAQIVFGTASVLVDCENEWCGNTTHISIKVCGECLDEESFITTRGIRDNASARRFLISGH